MFESRKYTRGLICLFLLFMLTGCGAMQVAIEKRDLTVSTKMSDTIFLDPVGAARRSVFIQVRNTSDKQEVRLFEPVRTLLEGRGYRVETDDPDAAHYLLQINILQAGKNDVTAARKMLNSGFGGVLAGAAAGYALHSTNRGLGYGGLAGGAVAFVANSMVKDVTHTLITDIQIAERVAGKVSLTEKQSLQQGNAGSTKVEYAEVSDRKKYQTRIVSMANKVNLKFEEALPELQAGLASSVSGLF